ncbi:MAG: ATP-binding protein [Elusimicrobia bacterium]|nr:ATP-binding protein [Elusimicrobiota bacterium]
MKSAFRDILLEKEFSRPLAYFRREQACPLLPQKALAVIGIRRSGKTTFLRQIWDDMLRSKPARQERLVYVNFFDERLFNLQAGRLGELLEAYYELHPHVDSRETLYFFLDEPQIVKGWEYFVDRLLRAHHRVFISGSSATLLSKEIASAMRGRSLSVEIFPFSFREILLAEKKETSSLGPRERATTLGRFKKYLLQGGFPETLAVEPSLRRRLLQDYLDAVLLRDIIERHNPSDPSAISHLLHLLMNQVGSAFTINKTCERLKAQGLKVNKPEISQALDWFYDSYLFFSVPILTESAHKRIVNPKKLYCIDTGMAHHQALSVSNDWGHLLENAIFLHLRRQTEAICYFKDARQREVDFVIRKTGKKYSLIQAAWSLQDSKTRQREIDALYSAMSELSIKDATLVTLDEQEEIRSSGKTIHVRPAWSFLLGFQA